MLEAKDAEIYLLSKILCEDTEKLFAAAVAAGVEAEHFTDPAHSEIWREWTAAKKAKAPLPDLVLIATKFPHHQQKFFNLFLKPEQKTLRGKIDGWCDLILQAAAGRKLHEKASKMMTDLRESSKNNREIFDDLRKSLDEWQRKLEHKKTKNTAEIAMDLAALINSGGLPHLPMFPANSAAAGCVKLYPGELMTVGAKSGGGKTAFSAQICKKILEGKRRVLYICTETNSAGILARITAQFSGISHDIIQQGKDKRADALQFANSLLEIKEVFGNFLHICGCETNIRTPVQIEAKVQEIEDDFGKVDAVIVDYFQQIQPDGSKEKNRNEQLIDIADAFNFMAQKKQFSLIVLSQLNRAGIQQGQKPDLDAIRDSSGIVDASSIVAFLFRDRNKQGQLSEKTHFYSVKTRNTKPFFYDLDWNGVGFEYPI